jgi:phosphoglycolate phosphatase-like HAD superfamily hydrolase
MYTAVSYPQVFFDFDGVIVDTNPIKTQNISKATFSVIKDVEAVSCFVEFFQSQSGLPREQKVEKFFPQQAAEILALYAALNYQSFSEIGLLPGVRKTLEAFRSLRTSCYVLSGGDKNEIHSILRNNNALHYFKGILAAPKTKREHLGEIALSSKALFFGDAHYDYQVALEFEVDFVFIFGHTCWPQWEAFFKTNVIHGIYQSVGDFFLENMRG